MSNREAWLKGIVAAAIAGGANGVITGFAAVGIDPRRLDLQAGLRRRAWPLRECARSCPGSSAWRRI